jgi:copper transport protein
MRGIVLLAAILAALSGTSAALAHASLIQSEPADRAVVAQPLPKLTLTFNEPVSPLVLRLVHPSGEVVELKNVAVSSATIAVALPAGLLRGTHLLSWRVISADGHPVGGALTFSVGQPSSAPALLRMDGDIRLRGAIWLARLVLYLGLFIGIGGAFYCRWVAASPPSKRVRTAVTIALECGLVAALVSVGLQGIDVLGLPLSDIRELRIWGSGLATAYGLTLCIAVPALALGLASVWVKGPITRLYSALALTGVGLALAASGHAATAGPAWATRPAVFLHGVSVAFWVGALLPLAAALHAGDSRSELVRFSKAIPPALLVLVVSGLLLAIVQLRGLDALWTTSYGMILSGKFLAVCALLAFGGTNRWLTPRVIEGDTKSAWQLIQSIRAEVAIIAVILGLVASWRFTPPPRSLLAAAAQPVHAHIHTQRAMADLQIEPAGAAGRQITLSLLDGEFGPLPAKEVLLVLSKPEAGIEPLRLPATHVEATIWRIDSVQLPISGRLRARVEILVSDFEKITIEDEIELR